MSSIISQLSAVDVAAFVFFVVSWLLFEYVTEFTSIGKRSTGRLMSEKRREWMLVLAERDFRIIDTSIMAGLLQGTAFFASASILAIGGCLALMGSTDQILQFYADLSPDDPQGRGVIELKILGLTAIFVYAFFKFGWAFRLYNYCSILIGGVPHPGNASDEERREKALLAAEMNIIAGKHFTAGLHGIFQALAYLGWFIGPVTFFITTVLVIAVIIRRQHFSKAHRILVEKQ